MNKIILISVTLVAVAVVLLVFTSGRNVSIPQGAVAVKPFDAQRYMGRWYEVARIDFKWEKGLGNVTAEYSLKENGTIKVVNRGYHMVKKEWSEAVGRAKLVGKDGQGRLKVSFFGPFFSGYNVIALDSEYRYALVVGNDTDFMWLLSREKTMPEEVKSKYLKIAEGIGIDTSRLLWTEQD